VDHHRPGPLAVRPGVGQVEPLGLVEVQLDGRDGLLVTAPVAETVQ